MDKLKASKILLESNISKKEILSLIRENIFPEFQEQASGHLSLELLLKQWEDKQSI